MRFLREPFFFLYSVAHFMSITLIEKNKMNKNILVGVPTSRQDFGKENLFLELEELTVVLDVKCEFGPYPYQTHFITKNHRIPSTVIGAEMDVLKTLDGKPALFTGERLIVLNTSIRKRKEIIELLRQFVVSRKEIREWYIGRGRLTKNSIEL